VGWLEKTALGQGWEDLEILFGLKSHPGSGKALGLRTLSCAILSEKDLALGLLQTAVAQLLPQPLTSIPEEKLLNQLQEVQEPHQEKQQTSYRWAPYPSPALLFPEPLPVSIYLIDAGEARGMQKRGMVLAKLG
jgi:hypothetical protein